MCDFNTNTSCFDGIIEAMLNTFGFEYPLFNLKKFSPNHLFVDKNSELILKRGTENNDVLYDIFGIKSTFHFVDIIEDLHEVIKFSIKNAPVGVFVDAINCKWTLFYKKQKIHHFILIVDIDKNNKIYKCIDSYYLTNGIIELTYSESEKIFEKIVLFEFSENETNLGNVITCLNKYICVPDKASFNNEKNNMINYISNLSVENIGTVDKLYVSPLLLKLKWIAVDKIDFAHALQYYDSKLPQPIFVELYSMLEFISNEVDLLKSALIRYVLTNKLNTGKISSYINNIYDANYQICLHMDSIIT